MSEADKRILDRSQTHEESEYFGLCAGVMDRCVDYGTRLLTRCHTAGALETSTPLLLCRQLIELLDAMSVLVRRACIDPCKPLLRTQFETSCALLWMAESDTLLRARQYDVHVRHSRIQWHERFDPATPAGAQFQADWNADEICKEYPFIPHDSQDGVRKLQHGLASVELANVEEEWQRIKREWKKSPPNWYCLFGGPKKIEDLARRLRKTVFYGLMYRLNSAYVHASDVHAVASMQNEKPVIMSLRNAKNVKTTVQFAIASNLESYRAMIKLYLDDQDREYKDWYTTQIRTDFRRILHTAVKFADNNP